MSKHSPTPWDFTPEPNIDILVYSGPDAICKVFNGPQLDGPRKDSRKDGNANAEYICRAVNCHDELLDALENMTDWMARIREDHESLVIEHAGDGFGMIDARAALYKAKGEKL